MTTFIPGERTNGIYTSEGTPGTVQIRLGFPTCMGNLNDRPRDAVLEVTDVTSRVRLFEARISADELLTLLGGGGVNVKADMPKRLDRVGKHAQNISTHLPHGATEEDIAKLEAAFIADGWETAERYRTNSGYTVTARRWLTPEQLTED